MDEHGDMLVGTSSLALKAAEHNADDRRDQPDMWIDRSWRVAFIGLGERLMLI